MATKARAQCVCRQSGRCLTSGGEVDDRETSSSGNLLDQFVGSLHFLGSNEQLVLLHGRQATDVSLEGTLVADRLHDVACSGLSLRPEHRGALLDAPEGLGEVAASADKRNVENCWGREERGSGRVGSGRVGSRWFG